MTILDPRDVPGLVAWYSADAETGYADGANVTGFTDRSGLGNHATRSAAGTLWKAAGGAGGGPRFQFQGNAWMVLPNVMNGVSAGTIVASIKSGGGINEGGHWNFDPSNFFGYYPSSNGSVYDNFGYAGGRADFPTSSYPVAITTWHRYAAKVASASARSYFVNNTSVGSASGGTVGFRSDPRIGEGQYPFVGDMGAILIYNRALTSAELADLDTWLAANPSGGAPAAPSMTVPLVAFAGSGSLAVTPQPSAVVIGEVAFTGGEGSLTIAPPERFNAAEMVLEILDPSLKQAPTAVTVTISEGWPVRDVDFYLDGTLVWTGMTDTYGRLSATSINVPEGFGAQGVHTITAQQVEAGSVSATFTLAEPPAPALTTMGPDAQAVDVPGAERPNGTRRWVLQDLLPEASGGIGSWIMPFNPREMTSPHLERSYSTHHTTAVGGRHHVMEGGVVPVEWTFSGFAPTQEMHDKLLAYGDLNRRFYVIDHRKRAWIVVFTSVDLTPRLHQNFNGQEVDGHDYTVTALVLDQEWVVPA